MKSARFQFTIFDVLLVLVVTGLGIEFVASKIIVRWADLYYEWPDKNRVAREPKWVVLMIVASLLGAALAHLCAFRWQKTGWRRSVFAMSGIFVAWLCIAGYFTWERKTFGGRVFTTQLPSAAGCKVFAEAQEIYHRTDHNKDGVLEFAQSLHDLSIAPDGTEIALIDRGFAQGELGLANMAPKAGYVFKVLTSQGAWALGGAKNYMKAGLDGKMRMTEGYAFVMTPIQYESTGRETFMISSSGIIYANDLDAKSLEIVKQMNEFNPDPAKGWVPNE